MIKKLLLVFLLTYPQFLHSSVEVDFNIWLNEFKITAQKKGISEETINISLKNVHNLCKSPFFFKLGLSSRRSCVTFSLYSLEALPQKGLQRFNKS